MNSNQNTLDGKTFAIGVLSITACILFVGFILIAMTPTPAYAIGQNDRGGPFILVTQQLSSSNEGIVVVDAESKKLILYGFDYNRKSLTPLDGMRLDQLRGVQRPPQPQDRGGRP